MTVYSLFTSTASSGPIASLVSGDFFVLGEGVTFVETGAWAVVGNDSGLSAHIYGSLFSINFGIIFGDDASADIAQRVFVGAQGTISSYYTGIVLRGTNSTVENHGTIYGFSNGVQIDSTQGGTSNIVNTGEIGASQSAVLRGYSGNETIKLVNLGTITGVTYAYSSYSVANEGIDQIVNRGTMSGDVSLGAGADYFDNIGGHLFGSIFGNNGADMFRPGEGSETIDGGLDDDTITFRTSGAVSVALDNSFANTGFALGDVYAAIERVYGSDFNDKIKGGVGINNLRGYGGQDSLDGGQAVDVLWGGQGNDVFIFGKLGEAGDSILDFSSIAGNNDSFNISAAAFGGGLVAGVLAAGKFVVRADNLAQDADDRFIFRTTDKTLWFDKNGVAAGGLTLVADLQAGAVISNLDIVII